MSVNPYQAFGYQKPPYGTKVDVSHPLAKNLAVAVLLNEGTGGQIRNEGFAEIVGTIAGNPVWHGLASGQEHPANLDFDGAGDVIDFGNHSRTAFNYGDSAVGMSFVALINKTSSASGIVVGKTEANGNIREFRVLAGNTTVQWVSQSGSVTIISASDGYAINEWHLIAGSCDPTGTVKAFLNGHPATGGSSSNPLRRDVNLAIGVEWNTYPATTIEFDGAIAFVYLWQDRLLSAEEHLALALDPYQMFEDRVRSSAGRIAQAPPSALNEIRMNTPGVGRIWMRHRLPVGATDEQSRIATGLGYGANALTPPAAGAAQLILSTRGRHGAMNVLSGGMGA